MKKLTLSIAVALLAGCVVTDTGNPPVRPTANEDLVSLMFLAGGSVTLIGEPGTIEPAEGVVEIVNLSSTADPVETAVAEDGSFVVGIQAEFGSELRLQVVGNEARSVPFDVDSIGGEPIVRPLSDCFVVPLETSVSGMTTLTLANDCDVAVELTMPRARRTPVGATLSGSLSLTALEPGASTVLTIQSDVADGTGHREILFVDLLSPEASSRPITVQINP